MKFILTLLLFLCISISSIYSQSNHKEVVLNFQKKLNEDYMNPKESPLLEKDLKIFKNHDFFPINKAYRVEAKFQKNEKPETLLLKTTTNRLPEYDIYGLAEFKINDKTYTLKVYQSHTSRESKEYKDYLLLPYTDLTNGDTTYGGGRYVEVKTTDIKGNTIIIDFNKSYNPYCAYNYRYSCVIPPRENDLDTKIEAGVKKYKKSR